jgi:hypothetical protein
VYLHALWNLDHTPSGEAKTVVFANMQGWAAATATEFITGFLYMHPGCRHRPEDDEDWRGNPLPVTLVGLWVRFAY